MHSVRLCAGQVLARDTLQGNLRVGRLDIIRAKGNRSRRLPLYLACVIGPLCCQEHGTHLAV